MVLLVSFYGVHRRRPNSITNHMEQWWRRRRQLQRRREEDHDEDEQIQFDLLANAYIECQMYAKLIDEYGWWEWKHQHTEPKREAQRGEISSLNNKTKIKVYICTGKGRMKRKEKNEQQQQQHARTEISSCWLVYACLSDLYCCFRIFSAFAKFLKYAHFIYCYSGLVFWFLPSAFIHRQPEPECVMWFALFLCCGCDI